jgi:4a-hydroxytetrahydrobiopterin dehydratase
MSATPEPGDAPTVRLRSQRCTPCHAGTPRLAGPQLTAFQRRLPPGWQVVDEHHLEKEFTFRNFRAALAFANAVGAIAEREDHHPDMYVAWGKVRLVIWTHKIDGLSENDFILAAKADAAMDPQVA